MVEIIIGYNWEEINTICEIKINPEEYIVETKNNREG